MKKNKTHSEQKCAPEADLGSETLSSRRECLRPALREATSGSAERARPACGRCRRLAPPLAGSSECGGQAPGHHGPGGHSPGARGHLEREAAPRSAVCRSQEAEGVLPSPQVPGHPGWLSGGGRKLPHLSCPGAQHWLCSRHRGAAVTPQTPAAHRKLCRAQSRSHHRDPPKGQLRLPSKAEGQADLSQQRP